MTREQATGGAVVRMTRTVKVGHRNLREGRTAVVQTAFTSPNSPLTATVDRLRDSRAPLVFHGTRRIVWVPLDALALAAGTGEPDTEAGT